MPKSAFPFPPVKSSPFSPMVWIFFSVAGIFFPSLGSPQPQRKAQAEQQERNTSSDSKSNTLQSVRISLSPPQSLLPWSSKTLRRLIYGINYISQSLTTKILKARRAVGRLDCGVIEWGCLADVDSSMVLRLGTVEEPGSGSRGRFYELDESILNEWQLRLDS